MPNIREISRRLFVFRLFFGQKAGECDDVCVDPLVAYGSCFPAATSVGRHIEWLEFCTGVNEDEWGGVKWCVCGVRGIQDSCQGQWTRRGHGSIIMKSDLGPGGYNRAGGPPFGILSGHALVGWRALGKGPAVTSSRVASARRVPG